MSILINPQTVANLVNQVFVSPLLTSLHLSTPTDPTWGRYLQHWSSSELALESDPDIQVSMYRVFIGSQGEPLEGETVQVRHEELDEARGRNWIFYKVWLSSKAQKTGRAAGSDLVMLHGYADYAGKVGSLSHSLSLLEAGYRLIIPDMPSHGRSTGLHAHLDSPHQLPDAVFAVLSDVSRWSTYKPLKRHIFGVSLGGYTALAYCFRRGSHIPIDAIFICCPLIGVAAETDQPWIVKVIGKAVRPIAGRLPLIPAIELADLFGDDPLSVADLLDDIRVYQGNLRISTGLSLLEGLETIEELAPHFRIPIRIVHGDKDKITSHLKSVEWINKAGSPDKSIKIYEGCPHVMYKTARTPEEVARIQLLFKDRNEWLLARV